LYETIQLHVLIFHLFQFSFPNFSASVGYAQRLSTTWVIKWKGLENV